MQVISACHRFLPSTFRLSTLRLLFIFNFSFLISSCGLDIEDPTPPSAPVWVQKSLPEEWPERGIDAHELGGIFLEWEPSTEADIAIYYLYRAVWYDTNDSLGTYDSITQLTIESTTDLTYIDRNIQLQTNYYYKLKSEDEGGNKSQYSDFVSYSLLSALSVNQMIPNGLMDSLNDNRTLSWMYDYSIEMEDYCITILDFQNTLIYRTLLAPTNYVSGSEHWRIPAEVLLESGQKYKWRVDASAHYLNGRETIGSESPWAIFFYANE